MMSTIAQNLDAIQQQLPTDREVTLVVVSKYASVEQMVAAYQWGIRDFGENRIQDVDAKQQAMPQKMVASIRWHFLGHLQRNKIKKTRHNRFTLIHSLDSLRLAQMLSEDNVVQQTVQPVLVQVNLTREPQKSGFLEEELLQCYEALIQLPGLSIQGLMTIGPFPPQREACLQCFCHLRGLKEQLEKQYGIPLPHLSMGMSQDFHHALDCGATIIRIGSGIFGT